MWNFCFALVIVLLFHTCSGCDGKPSNHAQAVFGNVMVDGEPLQAGQIIFVPIEQTPGPKVSARVRDGQFQIPVEQGPWTGEFRVQITTIPPDLVAFQSGASHEEVAEAAKTKQRRIAEKFNEKSELRYTVKANEDNKCEFHVNWAPDRS